MRMVQSKEPAVRRVNEAQLDVLFIGTKKN